MPFWVACMRDVRAWVDALGYHKCALDVASADASFRQYFRLTCGSESRIIMDASKEKEALTPYVDVTERLRAVGVLAPKIYAHEIAHGYLLIEDFGSTHYLDLLDVSNYGSMYGKGIDAIVKMQRADSSGLPLYDRDFLHFEMGLMPEWFIKYLGITLNASDRTLIEKTFDAISNVVLSQPQDYFVHRDYHSRNMMVTRNGDVGVIDFQDAMRGALTYDLVSLLKDCYIRFDPEAVNRFALSFRDKIGLNVDDMTFLRWFDFMGMQRHIKVLGVFCRLYLRDGKPGYLGDLPRVLQYTLEAADRYEETREFGDWLKKKTDGVAALKYRSETASIK